MTTKESNPKETKDQETANAGSNQKSQPSAKTDGAKPQRKGSNSQNRNQKKRSGTNNNKKAQPPVIKLRTEVKANNLIVSASTVIDGLSFDQELYQVPLGGIYTRKMQEFFQHYGKLNQLIGRNDPSVIPRNGEVPNVDCYKRLISLHEEYLAAKAEKDKAKAESPNASKADQDQTKPQAESKPVKVRSISAGKPNKTSADSTSPSAVVASEPTGSDVTSK